MPGRRLSFCNLWHACMHGCPWPCRPALISWTTNPHPSSPKLHMTHSTVYVCTVSCMYVSIYVCFQVQPAGLNESNLKNCPWKKCMRATKHKRERLAFRWRLLTGLCLNTYFSTKLKTNYILNMYVWFVYMQPLYAESTTTCMCRRTALVKTKAAASTVVLPSTRARVLNYSLQGLKAKLLASCCLIHLCATNKHELVNTTNFNLCI